MMILVTPQTIARLILGIYELCANNSLVNRKWMKIEQIFNDKLVKIVTQK